jgi:transglutaminase-like putative cysteine protease
MNNCVARIFFSIVAFATVSPAHAQDVEQLTTVDIRISSDLAVDATYHFEATPRVEAAVRGVAQRRWQVPSNQQVEVIEAFTRKADGRIIPADPKDFSTQNGIVGEAASFVDAKIQQVPFRDLSVGDTTVLTLRTIEKDHYIPGQYGQEWLVIPGAVKQTLEVTLRTPATLEIHSDAQQLAYQETRVAGDVVRRWSGSLPPMQPVETNAANLGSVIPSLRFSTIPSYEAIAKAYWEGAKDKSVATPEIRRLADDITKDKHDVRSQALALFDWVSRNIRYVAVILGNGAYVPNDSQTILSRRFGDCKDHAALLAALLNAKGIQSEQVLINAAAIYQLAKTATLTFNHVIVYIPALDLYVDPTVEWGSFNHLPTQDLDKPVLRVSDKGAVLARTPNPSVDDNVLELDTRIVFTEDAHYRGQTSVAARGEFSDWVRAYVAQVEAKGAATMLQTLATQRGLFGEFGMAAPPWKQTSEPFRMTTTWDAQQSWDWVQAGWRAPPGFSPLVAYPDLFFGPLDRNKRIYPAACRAGRLVQSVDVTLPEGIVPERLPAAIEASAPDFVYRQEWSGVGNHLRILTQIQSSCQNRVISPAQIDAVRAAFRGVEARINPLLRFNRTNAGRQETRRGGESFVAAAPSEKVEQ